MLIGNPYKLYLPFQIVEKQIYSLAKKIYFLIYKFIFITQGCPFNLKHHLKCKENYNGCTLILFRGTNNFCTPIMYTLLDFAMISYMFQHVSRVLQQWNQLLSNQFNTIHFNLRWILNKANDLIISHGNVHSDILLKALIRSEVQEHSRKEGNIMSTEIY